MDEIYLNGILKGVLPRWQFWKEYLIVQLEAGGKEIKKEKPGVLVSAEVIEKVKKIKSKTELKKNIKEIKGLLKKVDELCSFNHEPF